MSNETRGNISFCTKGESLIQNKSSPHLNKWLCKSTLKKISVEPDKFSYFLVFLKIFSIILLYFSTNSS
jgi:hypothetical protein